jgi:hypothetical protein
MLRCIKVMALSALMLPLHPALGQRAYGPFFLGSSEGGLLMVSKYRCQSDFHDVSVPGSIREEALHSIGSGAFAGCGTVRAVDLPDGLIRIESSAFWNCIGLELVSLPQTLQFIGKMAFYGCEKLSRIILPAALAEVESYAFAGNYRLEAIEVDEANARYASLDGMLIDREGTLVQFPFGKTNVFIAPPQIRRIGADAFADHGRLLAAAIPGQVLSIGDRAFANCSNLRLLQIQQGLTEIGEEAFAGCGALTKIILPASLTRMGGKVFRGCANLREVLFAGPPPEAPDDVFQGLPADAQIKVNAAAGGWGDSFGGRPVIAVGASGP